MRPYRQRTAIGAWWCGQEGWAKGAGARATERLVCCSSKTACIGATFPKVGNGVLVGWMRDSRHGVGVLPHVVLHAGCTGQGPVFRFEGCHMVIGELGSP